MKLKDQIKVAFLRLISANRIFIISDNALKDMKHDTFFILSTGRTGTQFLAKRLNDEPQVYAVHEPKPSRRLRLWTVAFFEGHINNTEMRDVLSRLRS